MRMVNQEEAVAKRQQLVWYASFSFRQVWVSPRMCGLRPLSIRWEGLVVHSTCTLNIVWHEAGVVALFYRHGARKGVHSVY